MIRRQRVGRPTGAQVTVVAGQRENLKRGHIYKRLAEFVWANLMDDLRLRRYGVHPDGVGGW
jgi:hypothetical protein